MQDGTHSPGPAPSHVLPLRPLPQILAGWDTPPPSWGRTHRGLRFATRGSKVAGRESSAPAGDPPLGDLPTGTPCLSPVSGHTSRRSTCGTSSKQHNFYQKKSQKHRTSTGMSHENQSSSESRSESPDFSVGMYVYV